MSSGEMAVERITKYPNCFGCGDSNPIGLGLDLRMEGESLVTDFVPREEHQGWPGIVHGGLIATLLYEVLENYAYYDGTVTMMKSMGTRFRRPATTGQRIDARSWLAERSGRNMSVSATLTDEEGAIIAEGDAALVVLSDAQLERLGLS